VAALDEADAVLGELPERVDHRVHGVHGGAEKISRPLRLLGEERRGDDDDDAEVALRVICLLEVKASNTDGSWIG